MRDLKYFGIYFAAGLVVLALAVPSVIWVTDMVCPAALDWGIDILCLAVLAVLIASGGAGWLVIVQRLLKWAGLDHGGF